MNKTERNTFICQQFQAGDTQEILAARYKLTKQRIQKILKVAGLGKTDRRRVAAPRNAFVGILVSGATKDAIETKAKEASKSISRYLNDIIEAKVSRRKVG